MLTNNKNMVKITEDNRRLCIIECNNDICKNYEYFDALYNEINSGVTDYAFYNYLMNIDIKNYNFEINIPKSDLYNDIVEINIPVIAKFLDNLICEKNKEDEDYEEDNVINAISYSGKDLFYKFNEFLKESNFNKIEMTLTKFFIELKDYPLNKKRKSTGVFYTIDFDALKTYLIGKKYMEPDDHAFIEDV